MDFVKTKENTLPYQENHRNLYRIEVSFSSETGAIGNWKIIE